MNDQKYAAELKRRAKLISKSAKSSAATKNPVTDRALRYRAVAAAPPGPKTCAWCGKQRLRGLDALVAHRDGHEEHSNPRNLAWSCRSCNALEAVRHKAAGTGRRTRQNNPKGKPARDGGAPNMGAWFNALETTKGRGNGDMTLDEAIALIHNTPASRRKAFNAVGQQARLGFAKARKDDMPDWAR